MALTIALVSSRAVGAAEIEKSVEIRLAAMALPGPALWAAYGVGQTFTSEKVDDALWNKFQAVRSGKELAVKKMLR